MIPKPLNEISDADLQALIANGVAEGRTIDYKRQMPGNSDSEKKEFLADASSFANTGGGDLVYGIDETGGLPTQIAAVQAADLDLEIRRLDSILGAGLNPRIRYGIKTVTTGSGGSVVVLRVERSWTGPHRVVFQGHDKFYGRNSAGKYSLDVNELRTAFALSSTTTERIRAFRTDRIIALSNKETPVPFMDGPTILLHCIPLEAFASGEQFDILPLHHDPMPLWPMAVSSWNKRLNLAGLLAFGTQQPCPSYTQLYRNGVIEVAQGRILAHEYQGSMVIPSVAYEKYLVEFLPKCFAVLQAIGANTPVVVALTLIRSKDLYMGVNSILGENGYPIDTDTPVLPEIMVQNFATPAGQIFKPIFDSIWNACGFPMSTNYDAQGNFRPRA
jgi:hypothetical protein